MINIKYQLKESMESHSTLNPVIWDEHNKIRPEVRQKLLDIVEEFLLSSEVIGESDLIDIELVGSNANYNYQPTSDIDLHLVVNMEDLSSDGDLAQIATNLEKAAFNKTYDIGIKGINVEIYVEDVKAGTTSNGIYSLKDDKWLKIPKNIVLPNYDNDKDYIEQLEVWRSQAQNALTKAESSEEVKQFINSIYNLRRVSLMTDGEYSKGNYIFKELRNDGTLQQLKDRKVELLSKELSLESVK